MNKITPFLWFNADAEQAAQFYISVIPNSRVLKELRMPEGGPGPAGSLLAMDLELNGQQVSFLNGGPAQKLSPAFSFTVRCKDQAEIDDYWVKLGEGGKELGCGWIEDKFSLCWQIVPYNATELIGTPAGMQAMLKMMKLDIATLEAAAAGSK
jgi:predicted 3-demethylubiquinone-9 3-methyltransferase (glyoxalase superfamily)